MREGVQNHSGKGKGWYPASGKLVVINNSGEERETVIRMEAGRQTVRLEPYGMAVLDGAVNGNRPE